MPKTNPSQRPNNYGLYGVLVLLLTAGYHHYFAKEEIKEETKKIVEVKNNKSNKAIRPSNELAAEPVLVESSEIKVAVAEEKEVDFINENDRQNCWDYIGRDLISREPTLEDAQERLENKLLKKYPDWFLSISRRKQVPKLGSLTNDVVFLQALNHFKFLNGAASVDPTRSPAKGLETLTNLYNDDPENSALLIYLAIAHDKMGNQKEVIRLLGKLEETKYFSSYRSFIMSDVYKNAETVNELFAAVIYKYRVVRPSYREVEYFAKKYDISRIGYQIMEKSLPESKYYNPFDWDEDEYIVGSMILEDRQPEVAKKYKSSTEYKEKIYSKYAFDENNISKSLAKECEVKTLENKLKQIHGVVAKYPIRTKMKLLRSLAGK